MSDLMNFARKVNDSREPFKGAFTRFILGTGSFEECAIDLINRIVKKTKGEYGEYDIAIREAGRAAVDAYAAGKSTDYVGEEAIEAFYRSGGDGAWLESERAEVLERRRKEAEKP